MFVYLFIHLMGRNLAPVDMEWISHSFRDAFKRAKVLNKHLCWRFDLLVICLTLSLTLVFHLGAKSHPAASTLSHPTTALLVQHLMQWKHVRPPFVTSFSCFLHAASAVEHRMPVLNSSDWRYQAVKFKWVLKWEWYDVDLVSCSHFNR